MEDQTATGPDGLTRPPADARCAVHAGVEATAVCRRCGNYMCPACSRDGSSPQCDACRARGGTEFPFSRERWSFSELVEYCWKRFKVEWLMLSVTALIFIALIYGIAFALTFAGFMLAVAVPDAGAGADRTAATVLRISIEIAQFLLQVALQLWLQLGFFAVGLDVAEGRPAQVGRLFSQLDRFPAALLQLLIVYAGMAAYAAPLAAVYLLVPGEESTRQYAVLAVASVLLLPALYVALGCAFAMLELVHDPSASAISALRTSFALVRDRRLVVAGSAIAIGLIMAGGLLACCVGAIPSSAFAVLVYCGLFLALKTPTPEGARRAA